MTSPVRAAAAAASSASTALRSHNGKNKISEQQTSADLATQNGAKRLKLNDGSAAAGAGAEAAASGPVASAAHAALRASAAAVGGFTGVMSLSDFNGQIRYLGPNCLTVVLSYLQVREIQELSNQLFTAHLWPIANPICNPENCTQLQGLINGYYQMANSPVRVHFSDFNYTPPEKTNSKDVLVHSPVLFSQLAGIKTLTLDYIYLLAVSQQIPLETIFKSVGSGLLELNLEKFGDWLAIDEDTMTVENHRAISQLLADIILFAGKYCPNLMRLELPTKSWNAIHGIRERLSMNNQTSNSNKLLVVTAFAKSVEKWKELCSIEFNSLYDISHLLPTSLVSVSIFSLSRWGVQVHNSEFHIAKRYPNLESFRAINYVQNEVFTCLG